MLAISYASHIRLWGIAEDGSKNDIGESLKCLPHVTVLLCGNFYATSVNAVMDTILFFNTDGEMRCEV